jgi:hypothetical protein
MQERFFTDLREDMDVCDRSGEKLGTIGTVYPRVATGATMTTEPAFGAPSAGDIYFKVDSGFLGLGKDLYIPASAILDVTGDRVLLDVDKDRVDTMTWDRRPSFIPEDEG